MKRIFVAAMLAICVSRCEAAQDVQVVLGSGTYSGAWVSSGSIMRVDHLVRGSTTTTVPSNRIGIEIQNLDSTYNIWCAYDTSFTTATTNRVTGQRIGKRIGPGDVVFIGALRQATYNCVAPDEAGGSVWIHTEQVYKE